MDYRKDKVFKTRFKLARKLEGLTQRDLSRRAEMTPATINNYEKGNRLPFFKQLKLLSEVLKVSTDFLLGIDNNKKQREIIERREEKIKELEIKELI